jgi:AAA domain
MAISEIDLSGDAQGVIVAPAGCGKTELVANTLRAHAGSKPILVLTHTNAGVAALKHRLNRAKVDSSRYRLSTIDGWALRLVSMFPGLSELTAEIREIKSPKTAYPKIREAAGRMLAAGHITDPLQASYARVIVDEYQDCSLRQHLIVKITSSVLPTCVLGDPMQAIFGFNPSDPLIPWRTVIEEYGLLGELTVPWRWINSHHRPLGDWLLTVRRDLMIGRSIDLRSGPSEVKWIELVGSVADHMTLASAARWTGRGQEGSVLVIGSSTNAASRHKIASTVKGATVVEPVDLSDLVNFCAGMDFAATNALEQLLEFGSCAMTGISPSLLSRRVKTLTAGKSRKAANAVERAAVAFELERSHSAGAELLVLISQEESSRSYRPTVLRGCIRALQLSAATEGLALRDAAVRIREEQRVFGRTMPKRAVGSTLLLKGLEAEGAVVLCADEMNSRNLYVAMTRGSSYLTVCCKSPVLCPSS